MAQTRWEPVESLFHRALEMPSEARDDFLAKASGGEQDIIDEDLLDRGATQAAELSEQPEVQAQMLHTVGRVYAVTGRGDRDTLF